MTSIRYFTTAEVVAIHAEIMRRLGEAPEPLRDAGFLESAITRPQMASWYKDADLIRQGALLAVGISQAQTFVDGNKRTAFATLDAFFFVNGWALTGDQIDLAPTRRDRRPQQGCGGDRGICGMASLPCRVKGE